ncbi:MAG: HAMP domain-containing sensor histidine kinase [Myxococcota bacterium]
MVISLAKWIRERHDAVTLSGIAERSGLLATDLDGRSQWTSHDRFEAFLRESRVLFDSDEAFIEACAFRLVESYGAFRHLIWALSPLRMYLNFASNLHMVSKISRYEAHDPRRNRVTLIYRTDREESRLMCLARQGQAVAMPTLWGMPKAHLREGACVAHGDDRCEYHLTWQTPGSWWHPMLGAMVGASVSGMFVAAGAEPSAGLLAWPVVGTLAGAIHDLLRRNGEYLDVLQQANEALRELAEDDSDARRELMAIGQRQRDWGRLMEERVTERTAALQNVVQRIQLMSEERHTTLKGFSHDLRNPLFVLKGVNQLLRRHQTRFDERLLGSIDDHERAVEQMEHLLNELMEVASSDGQLMRIRPESIDVQHLTKKLRRRLRALVHGRDIRVSVFRNRETPETIRCDRLLMDRVLDNLLTNSVKYTDHGSILVEVGGSPGYLTIKVSDTGQGITNDRIERIFDAQSVPKRRRPDSCGIGLSVVLRLMDQIGGRIEVMSKPDVGSTFWAHFPTEVKKADVVESIDPTKHTHQQRMGRVVTIRRA